MDEDRIASVYLAPAIATITAWGLQKGNVEGFIGLSPCMAKRLAYYLWITKRPIDMSISEARRIVLAGGPYMRVREWVLKTLTLSIGEEDGEEPTILGVPPSNVVREGFNGAPLPEAHFISRSASIELKDCIPPLFHDFYYD